jgi:hypothetical protein
VSLAADAIVHTWCGKPHSCLQLGTCQLAVPGQGMTLRPVCSRRQQLLLGRWQLCWQWPGQQQRSLRPLVSGLVHYVCRSNAITHRDSLTSGTEAQIMCDMCDLRYRGSDHVWHV